jgi:NAD(P)-dependent dehydrogenase (short-subunit alcohol dehydrogenase family)
MENRVAVISGATGSLGPVAARGLAEQGARLALLGTNAERLKRLGGELGLPAERWLIGAFDLTTPVGAQGAARAVIRRFGRAEILLHLIGGWAGGKPVAEVPEGDMAAMLRNHLWSTFYLAQAFVPHLVANKWGRVMVVSSPHAVNPPAKSTPYVAAKAAQEALIMGLAREVAGSGVTANILQVRTIDANHERDREPTPQNASWTTPEEITAAILYLCSDEARMVNGARIPLYGGG